MEVEVLNQGRRHGNWRRPGARRALVALLAVAVIYWLLSLAQWWLQQLGPVERESAEIGWSPAAANDTLARDVFDRVNDERAARGLDPLQWDDGLALRARAWAEEMIEDGFGRPPEAFFDAIDRRRISENVAWASGTRPSCTSAGCARTSPVPTSCTGASSPPASASSAGTTG